ncbi:MAG: hypothetical protein M1838_000925 [Thelocarpon superellum]|nr:MAG: hypothetical protein M1838_000925 [Thelocarpon superellum]
MDDSRPLIESREGAPYGTPYLSKLGVAYVVVNAVWMCMVLAGIFGLYYFRKHEYIRKRNPFLIITAVFMIQIYVTAMLMINPLNGSYPCILNYWVMSIYFPLGIALFQAANLQLLSVSAMQRELRAQPLRRPTHFTSDDLTLAKLRARWQSMTLLSRIYYSIGICVVTQIIISIIIFFLSRKFVSFGIAGHAGTNHTCTQGWEWIPTILYQGLWTYGFGPWLVWKIRHIHDVYRWKVQTVLTIVFSLPGLPMWLASSNSKAFQKVVPSWSFGMWFVPGLMMMEFVSLAFPLWEVYKAYRRRTPAVEPSLASSAGTDLESGPPGQKSKMQAFEDALRENAGDLLEYAATREFTGENIVFLIRVRRWKETWQDTEARKGNLTLDQRQKLFASATDIFERSVSLQSSQFPINVESDIYLTLNKVFGREKPTSVAASVVAPFSDPWAIATIARINEVSEAMDGASLARSTSTKSLGVEVHQMGNLQTTSSEHLFASAQASIPEGFDSHVFDRAERSVKYMVLTNTWARYVNARRSSSGSTVSSWTYNSKEPRRVSQWTSATQSVTTTGLKSKSDDMDW